MGKIIKLQGFTKKEFLKIIKTIGDYATDFASEQKKPYYQNITFKLSKTNLKKGVCFYGLSIEEFRDIVIITDLYNVIHTDNKVIFWDYGLEDIFKKLENLFIRKYKKPVYESR
jgi:hypothetical protein